MSDKPKKKKSFIRRLLKWTGITFLLLLITVIVLPFIFKDKIIEYAKQEVNKNLNAKVDWGDFELSLFSTFPDFRFTIHNVRITGVKEFEKDTLANLPLLKLDMDLMSVISGSQYKVNSVYVENPRILAKVLADGKANWDIMKPDSTAASPAAASEPTKFKLALKKFEIKGGYIVYDDASLGVKTVLDSMNHTLKGDFTQDNFVMETQTDIARFTQEYAGMTYLKKAKVDMKANLDMDMKNWKFTFKDNDIKVNELGLGIDGYFAMPGDDYDMDMKFKAKQTDFKNILSLVPAVYTPEFKDVKTSGKLALDGYVKGFYSEKKNTMPGWGVNLNIADGMFQYPSLPKSVTGINIDLKVDDASGIPDKMVIDAKKIAMNIGGSQVGGMLHVETPVSDASIMGTVYGTIDLAKMRDVIPVEKGDELNGRITADVKMKGRMSTIDKGEYDKFDASGKVEVMGMVYKTKDTPYDIKINTMTINFSPQFVELANFDSKIGKSDIHADGRIDNLLQYIFKDQLLKGTFKMNSGTVDLNEFMGSDEAAPADTAKAATSSDMAVIEVPGNIDFTLNTTIGKLLYDNLSLTNVSGGVTIRDKKVDLSQLKMNAMGGTMVMNGSYATANAKQPKVDFDLAVTDFDIQQTFNSFNTVQKLAPIGKYAKGKFSTSLKITSDLDGKMMPLMNSIAGLGKLSTKQVEVDGFGPLVKLDDALKLNKFKKIMLSDISPIGFHIKDGRVNVDPCNFKMGNTVANLENGSTGLDQSIDYRWNVTIPRSEFGGAANSALTSLTSQATAKLGKPVTLGDKVDVAVLFGGTVTNPTVKTSLKQAAADLKNEVKDIVKDQIKNTVDDAKAKARAEADKILADAKVQADKIKADAANLAKQTHDAGYKQADDLEKSAKNPIEKVAKKKLADEGRKKTDAAAKKITDEADQKANAIMAAAQKQADEKLK